MHTLTAPELTKLRGECHTRVNLSALEPAVVYTCMVNQTFATGDMVAQFAFDTGAGTLANVLPGMTVYIGSTAGAYDKGLARVRKAWDAAIAYVGEGSEIVWADNLYITVVDEFDVWPRHLKISGGVVYCDYDVAAAGNADAETPFANFGGHRAGWLVGASKSFVFNAAASFCPGSTISTYTWSTSGGTLSGSGSSRTLTVTAAGTYRVTLTVTAANGKTKTGYRYVFVHDTAHPPIQSAALNSLSASADGGGWNAEVTRYDTSTIRPRSLYVIWADDWYNGTAGSVGETNNENVLFVGWADAETIKTSASGNSVSFAIRGAQHWLAQVSSYPIGFNDTASGEVAWEVIPTLTVDKAVGRLLSWYTTLPNCADVTLTGDTRRASQLRGEAGNLWGSISTIAHDSILAEPYCDKFGGFGLRISPSLGGAALTSICSLTKADSEEEIGAEYAPVPPASQVNLSGVSWDGATSTPYFSLSNGHVYRHFGSAETLDRLLLSDQAQANALAGYVMGDKNNQFPAISIALRGNWHWLECSGQAVDVTLSPSDNPLGREYTGQALPREIDITYSAETGAMHTRLTLAAKTDAEPATDGDIPEVDGGIDLPPIPPPPPPPPPLPPPFTDGMYPLYIVLWLRNFGFFRVTRSELENTAPAWEHVDGITPSLSQIIYTYSHSSVLGPRAWDTGLYGSGTHLWIGDRTRIWHGTVEDGVKLVYSRVSSDYSFYVSAIGANSPAIFSGLWAHPYTGEMVACIRPTEYWTEDVASVNDNPGTKILAFDERGKVSDVGTLGANTSVPPDEKFRFAQTGNLYSAAINENGEFMPAAYMKMPGISNYRTTALGEYGGEFPAPAESAYLPRCNFGFPARVWLCNSTGTLIYRSVKPYLYTDLWLMTIPGYSGYKADCNNLAFDPTGKYGMFIERSNPLTMARTEDYGDNWTAVTLPAGMVYSGNSLYNVQSLGSPAAWMVYQTDIYNLSSLKLYVTFDNGATWQDKIGDLRTVLARYSTSTDTQKTDCRIVLF